MTPNEIQEMEELKSVCFTTKGTVRKRVDQAKLSKFTELNEKLEREHGSLKVDDDARITQVGHKTILNVCGKQMEVYGPPKRKPKR